jgi:hypothetical protein
MRGSRIKENGSRDRVDTERTQHDLWRLLRRFHIHMVHPCTIGCHLLIAIPGRILLIGLLWTIVRHVSFLAAAVTLISMVRCTILHRSIVGWILAWCPIAIMLLWTLTNILLSRILRTLATTLLGVLRTLLVRAPVPLVRRSLVPLWETYLCVGTGTGVTPRCLSLEPPLFGIHLSTIIVYHNGIVH